MRILFLLDYLYGDAGGGTEKQFLQLYERYPSANIDARVAFLKDAAVHHKIPWLEEPVVLNVRSLKSPVAILRAVVRLLRVLRDNRIHVVHTIYDDAAFIGAILKVLAPDIRVIMSMRNMGHEQRGAKRRIMARVYHKADRMLVNASAIGRLLVSDYAVDANRIGVIANIYNRGSETEERFDDSEFEDIRRRHSVLAVAVSNLRDIKGIPDLIHAIEIVRDSRDIGVVVIGEGDERVRYERMIEKANLQRCIYLVGYRERVLPYLQRADFGILASHSEGLPNALIEYGYAGLASVATDVGGSREVLEDGQCGLLVEAGNPQSLADGILQLLNDTQLRQRLGRRAGTAAHEKYNADTIIGAYRDEYRALRLA